MSKSVKAVIGEEEWKGKTVESAEQVGKCLVKCASIGHHAAVFDRADFSTTVAKAVADGARAAGVTMSTSSTSPILFLHLLALR